MVTHPQLPSPIIGFNQFSEKARIGNYLQQAFKGPQLPDPLYFRRTIDRQLKDGKVKNVLLRDGMSDKKKLEKMNQEQRELFLAEQMADAVDVSQMEIPNTGHRRGVRANAEVIRTIRKMKRRGDLAEYTKDD